MSFRLFCCPQDERGDGQVRGLTGREQPRAEKLVSCAFLFFVFYQHLYELQLGGLSRRWRAPTESSAVDGEVIHPLIPVLASFLICFLTSFLFCVIRDPILLILPSEGSHGIFYGPAASPSARGIDGWGSPRLLGTTARRAKLPLFYILESRMLLFHVSHPILLMTPFLVFDRLGEYICGIAV